MSIYTCIPAGSLMSSSEEYKAKGIQGTKCPPSASPVTLYDPVYANDRAEFIHLRWLRICGKEEGKMVCSATKEQCNMANLPDLPLPLPRCVFAINRSLTARELKDLNARKYVAGRTKYKFIYTLTVPTTPESVSGILKLPIERDYVPPSGFVTPITVQSFVMVRKALYAHIATLPIGGRAECDTPMVSTENIGSSTIEVVSKKSLGIEEDQVWNILSVPVGGLPQGVAPGMIPNRKELGYFFFPYFKGSVGSDKVAIRRALVDFLPAFQEDISRGMQFISSLMISSDKALEGEHGRVVAHLAHVSSLLAKAGMFGVAITVSREYLGIVGMGSKKSIASDCYGNLVPAGTFEELQEALGNASTALVSREKIAEMLSHLELDEESVGDDGEKEKVVDVSELSSSYRIWYLLYDRASSFNSNESNARSMREYLSTIDTSEDVRREFTPEGFDSWVSWMANEDLPYSYKSGSDKYMNLTAINFSFEPIEYLQGIFGGISYSPIWPGGKKMVIPAPGADDKLRKPKEVLVKKGDQMEKQTIVEFEHLHFVRCSPQQAAKDWKQVFESGAIWQPSRVLTKKEKMNCAIWSGESLSEAWETLKTYCHKATKEPEAKRAKIEEKGPEVSKPTVDLFGMSAW